MTNTYSINGSIAYLEVPGPKGALLICLLDTEDLPIAADLPGCWCSRWGKSSKTFYVSGNVDGAFPGLNGKKYRSSLRSTPEAASAWYWAKRRSFGIPDPGQHQGVPIKLAA